MKSLKAPACIAFLHTLCCDSSLRYVFDAVCVGRKDNRGFAAATDSKVLVVLEWDSEGLDCEWLIGRKYMEQMAMLMPDPAPEYVSDARHTLTVDDVPHDRVSLTLSGGNMAHFHTLTFPPHFTGVRGDKAATPLKFPPWRTLFFDAPPCDLANGSKFDALLMGVAFSTIRNVLASDTYKDRELRLSYQKTRGPMFVSASMHDETFGKQHMRALLMQLSDDDKKET